MVLELLIGDPAPAMLPKEGCLLYCYSNRMKFVRKMPSFDEWGLRPVSLEGPRESPLFVFPLPASTSTLTPEAGAGGEHRRTPAKWLPRKRCRSWPPRWWLLGLG